MAIVSNRTCINGCIWVVIDINLGAAVCHRTIRLSSTGPCKGKNLPWDSLHHLISSVGIEHLLIVGKGCRCRSAILHSKHSLCQFLLQEYNNACNKGK